MTKWDHYKKACEANHYTKKACEAREILMNSVASENAAVGSGSPPPFLDRLFNAHTCRCPKCEQGIEQKMPERFGTGLEVRYVPGDTRTIYHNQGEQRQDVSFEARMRVGCQRCGFVWFERPADGVAHE